jgi:hypothetical protein
MAVTAPSKGIFRGTDEIVSAFLDLRDGETLKQKSTCRRLVVARNGWCNFETLIVDLYDQITKNRSDRLPSQKNWRSESQTTFGRQNRSPEILLEHAIAILSECGILEGWVNQVPVASGLVDGMADKRAAVDLVRHRDNQADFIELKWESDTPAYAAFEILRYGLAYLLSYINRETFKYAKKPLMNIKEISLRVLAPRAYYDDSDLTWLSEGIDHGIRTLVAQKTGGALSMDFGFLAFPSNFDLPFSKGEEVLSMADLSKDAKPCQLLISALCGIEPIWCNSESRTP